MYCVSDDVYLSVRCVCDDAARNPLKAASVAADPNTAAARMCRNTLPASTMRKSRTSRNYM